MKLKVNKQLLKIICCPRCKRNLVLMEEGLYCKYCKIPFKSKKGILNFLPNLDSNKKEQGHIWNDKTYLVDPVKHKFTTIQEKFSSKLIHSQKLPKDAVVLDVGSFIGEKLWQLDKTNRYLGIGIDIAVDSLVAGKISDIDGNEFIAADVEALPFKSNSVDFLMVFDVIEHLSDQAKGFSEISRVLKPGGIFLLHIPIKDNRFSMFWWKQMLFPGLAQQDYKNVGHSSERMLTTIQIKEYLIKNSLMPKKEIFYNAFFTHLFDRELPQILWGVIIKFLGKKPDTKNKNEKPIFVKTGKLRELFAIFILPILEKISYIDKFLSMANIGNTYFIFSKKKR